MFYKKRKAGAEAPANPVE